MAEIRKGMWVVLAGQGVGIVAALNEPRDPANGRPIGPVMAELHLVDGSPIGETRLVLNVPPGELRKARLEEIPPLRRQDPAFLARLGYE